MWKNCQVGCGNNLPAPLPRLTHGSLFLHWLVNSCSAISTSTPTLRGQACPSLGPASPSHSPKPAGTPTSSHTDWTVPGCCPLFSILTITCPASSWSQVLRHKVPCVLSPHLQIQAKRLRPVSWLCHPILVLIESLAAENQERVLRVQAPSLMCLPCLSHPWLVPKWLHSFVPNIFAPLKPSELSPAWQPHPHSTLEPYHLLLDLPNADPLPNGLGFISLCPEDTEADATWSLISLSTDFPASCYSPCAVNT